MRGPGNVALGQHGADPGRGDGDAVLGEQRNTLDSEVVLLAELGEQPNITGRLVPEPGVLPDDHAGRVQAVYQYGADELVRAEPGELQRERDDAGRRRRRASRATPTRGGLCTGGADAYRAGPPRRGGSNVTTTDGQPSSAADSTARATIR